MRYQIPVGVFWIPNLMARSKYKMCVNIVMNTITEYHEMIPYSMYLRLVYPKSQQKNK